ncbi:MAG: NUDIX hydrolase [Anaerolineae bacterium]
MIEPWQPIETRDGFRNRWLHVTLDTVRLPNDRSYEYTTIRRDKPGVAVAVIDAQDRLLLEREYRLPVDEVIYQLPGGLADVDEDLVDSMRRELREETGILAGHLRHLGCFWNNPASSNGQCHIFLCRDFQAGLPTDHDAAEFLSWEWRDLSWVKTAVADGRIRDRVVLCALAYLWLAGELT